MSANYKSQAGTEGELKVQTEFSQDSFIFVEK